MDVEEPYNVEAAQQERHVTLKEHANVYHNVAERAAETIAAEEHAEHAELEKHVTLKINAKQYV